MARMDTVVVADMAAGQYHAPSLFFFSSRRRHTRLQGDWSSDVCSSDLTWLVKFPPVAAVVGWPLIRPEAGVNASPAGKVPVVTDQVYCPVPPVAVKVCE